MLTLMITAVLAISLRGTDPGWAIAFWMAAILLFASQPAITLINWMITLLVPPRFLPSLDFARGIPPEHRTIVVVPTMLGSPAQNVRLLEDLEIRYLANKSPNLWFALLTDFSDADAEELPSDHEQIEAAVKGIQRLNQRYAGKTETLFFLLHRPRQ